MKEDEQLINALTLIADELNATCIRFKKRRKPESYFSDMDRINKMGKYLLFLYSVQNRDYGKALDTNLLISDLIDLMEG